LLAASWPLLKARYAFVADVDPLSLIAGVCL